MCEPSVTALPEISRAKDVFRALRISDPTGYRLLRSGALRGVRIGHVWRVSRAEVLRYLGMAVTGASQSPLPITDPA